MRTITAWSWLVALGVTASASAQSQDAQAVLRQPKTTSASAKSEVDSYCRYVESVAESEAQVPSWPRLRASFGTYRGLDIEAGTTDQSELSARLMAGLQYDLFDLYRGVTLGDRARAECRLYRATTRLRDASQLGPSGQTRAALRKRIEVLDAALPEGEAQAKALEAELASGHATLEELAIVERGLDAVRLSRFEAQLALDRTALDPAEVGSLSGMLDEFRAADAHVERYESRLRTLSAWGFSLNGGYDHVFRDDDQVPLYAMATLTYAFGGVFQGAANSRAERARAEWSATTTQGARHTLEETVAHLRALVAVEREQLVLVRARVQRLDERGRTLAAIADERARTYARAVWFELVAARAEEAYLAQHLLDIETLLGETKAGSQHAR